MTKWVTQATYQKKWVTQAYNCDFHEKNATLKPRHIKRNSNSSLVQSWNFGKRKCQEKKWQ